MGQFRILCHRKGWEESKQQKKRWHGEETDEELQKERQEKERQKDEAWGLLSNAIAREFNLKYGVDVSDVKAWKGLCEVINMRPIPDKLEDCRKVRALYSAFGSAIFIELA